MIAEKRLEAFTSLPESTKTIVFAFSVIIDRIRTLSLADRNDLFALVMELPNCEDEESRSGICRAMEEILAQMPMRATRMDPMEATLSPGLKKWAEHAGGRIKEFRLGAGLNQEELAAKSGLTQSHISRLERGEHSPNHFTLEKIATALGIEVGQLDPSTD